MLVSCPWEIVMDPSPGLSARSASDGRITDAEPRRRLLSYSDARPFELCACIQHFGLRKAAESTAFCRGTPQGEYSFLPRHSARCQELQSFALSARQRMHFDGA